MQRLLPVAAAQEIQRGVVRDAEQPALRIDRRDRLQRFHRLDQRILQHILTVDDRADHAGAVAMQFRSHPRQQGLGIDGGKGVWRHCFSASLVQDSSSIR